MDILISAMRAPILFANIPGWVSSSKNVVSAGSLGERLVVHLHGLDLSGQLVGGESDDHAVHDDSGLDTAHWNCSNTSNFVNILRKRRLKIAKLKFRDLVCFHQ
jgi:hypothetical protein